MEGVLFGFAPNKSGVFFCEVTQRLGNRGKVRYELGIECCHAKEGPNFVFALGGEAYLRAQTFSGSAMIPSGENT